MNDLTLALEPLAAKLARVLAEKADLTAEENALKAEIRALTNDSGPDMYSAGAVSIKVTPNTRFNEAKALGLIPADTAHTVTYPETKVDKERLRVLMPDVYDAATDVYDNKIQVI